MNKTIIRDSAFTGLEAAIVLVAFIIVASVFAYTILGVGFMTTQKSQEVVHSSIVGVSSVLQLTGDVYGISEGSDEINMINFTVSLAPGGSPIDFNRVVITYSNDVTMETLTPVSGLQSTSTTPGTWAITRIDGVTGTANTLLEKGEQYSLSVHPVSGTPKDKYLNVEIKSGGGSAITIKRTVPAGVNTVNILH
jgi:archaeal flagellin FlaB